MLNHKQEFEVPLAKLLYDGGKVGLLNILSTNQYNNANVISTRMLGGIDQRAVFRLNDREDNSRFFDTVKVPEIHLPGEFNYREFGRPVAGKGLFLSTEEIERVCDYIGDQPGFPSTFALPWYFDETETEKSVPRDVLFEDAARLIVSSQMGSTSLIQRRMKLGYNRAGLLMDQLEKYGIVGPNSGSRAREVMIKTDNELREFLDNIQPDTPYTPPVNQMHSTRENETPVANSTYSRVLPKKTEKPGCLLFLIAIGFIVVWYLI
jgi:S-DNA-T family DNA segregation ATPase FtsK/SpoIIIE